MSHRVMVLHEGRKTGKFGRERTGSGNGSLACARPSAGSIKTNGTTGPINVGDQWLPPSMAARRKGGPGIELRDVAKYRIYIAFCSLFVLSLVSSPTFLTAENIWASVSHR